MGTNAMWKINNNAIPCPSPCLDSLMFNNTIQGRMKSLALRSIKTGDDHNDGGRSNAIEWMTDGLKMVLQMLTTHTHKHTQSQSIERRWKRKKAHRLKLPRGLTLPSFEIDHNYAIQKCIMYICRLSGRGRNEWKTWNICNTWHIPNDARTHVKLFEFLEIAEMQPFLHMNCYYFHDCCIDRAVRIAIGEFRTICSSMWRMVECVELEWKTEAIGWTEEWCVNVWGNAQPLANEQGDV